MKHYFIVNPAAGKGNKAEQLKEDIRAVAEERGIEYEIYTTAGIGDATRFVKEKCAEEAARGGSEILRFYAAGGDGTLNETVVGTVGYDNAEVAVIPIGTGNDFTKSFGEREDFLDIGAQIDGNTVSCDLIAFNDTYCVNMVNIGFDCGVVVRTARIKTHPLIPGKLAYIFGLIGEFIYQRGVTFRCTLDGEYHGEKKLLLSLFANGAFCGGGFRSAPYAATDDGVMDVCFIKYVKRLTFVKKVGGYKKGTFMLADDCDKIFEYYKCSEVQLDFDRTQKICVDGEITECDSLHLKMMRDALRFVVPKGAQTHYEKIAESRFVRSTVSV